MTGPRRAWRVRGCSSLACRPSLAAKASSAAAAASRASRPPGLAAASCAAPPPPSASARSGPALPAGCRAALCAVQPPPRGSPPSAMPPATGRSVRACCTLPAARPPPRAQVLLERGEHGGAAVVQVGGNPAGPTPCACPSQAPRTGCSTDVWLSAGRLLAGPSAVRAPGRRGAACAGAASTLLLLDTGPGRQVPARGSCAAALAPAGRAGEPSPVPCRPGAPVDLAALAGRAGSRLPSSALSSDARARMSSTTARGLAACAGGARERERAQRQGVDMRRAPGTLCAQSQTAAACDQPALCSKRFAQGLLRDAASPAPSVVRYDVCHWRCARPNRCAPGEPQNPSSLRCTGAGTRARFCDGQAKRRPAANLPGAHGLQHAGLQEQLLHARREVRAAAGARHRRPPREHALYEPLRRRHRAVIGASGCLPMQPGF